MLADIRRNEPLPDFVASRLPQLDLMIREIGDKYSLILFPEGHRNPEGEMGEFKSGLYYLGKKRVSTCQFSLSDL